VTRGVLLASTLSALELGLEVVLELGIDLHKGQELVLDLMVIWGLELVLMLAWGLELSVVLELVIGLGRAGVGVGSLGVYAEVGEMVIVMKNWSILC
jgi:hypothetical protein